MRQWPKLRFLALSRRVPNNALIMVYIFLSMTMTFFLDAAGAATPKIAGGFCHTGRFKLAVRRKSWLPALTLAMALLLDGRPASAEITMSFTQPAISTGF